jgi:hypothetical protein
MAESDRRRDPRFPLQRRVKLMCTGSGRCFGGTTTNCSAGGALVELDGSPGPLPGEAIRVGIDWTGGQGLMRAELMPDASVVRSMPRDGHDLVAIVFAQPQHQAA